MVLVGLAVTLVPVVADKPVAGLHAYVLAPLAVSTVLLPLHIVPNDALAPTVGFAFTVIDFVAVLVQPLPFVTV